jgi:hypothetical protein
MAMMRRWIAFPLSRIGFGLEIISPNPGQSGPGVGDGSGDLDFSFASNSAWLLVI